LSGKTGAKRTGDWEVDVAAMAGSLVHEIKNPLSTLNINAQLLLEEWKDATTPRETRAVKRLRVMVSEVERLERIMQSFLRFTERHEIHLKHASVNDLLADLVDFVGPEARTKGIEVRLGLDGNLGPFAFDPDLIRQVFLNLVLNAMHAMETRGGDLIIRTRVVERDGSSWAVGDVIDTGHGIPPHVRPKIFAPYFSTRRDGSGLGLATSKRIAEEHGGFIDVESEVGRGSQFSVFLPLRRAVPAGDGTLVQGARGS
jgi:signal transduction histidine kinase